MGAAILNSAECSEVNSEHTVTEAGASGVEGSKPRRSERTRNPPQRYGYVSKRISENLVDFGADCDMNWRKSGTVEERFLSVFENRVVGGRYMRH
jgi:hypothetical protein